MVTLSQLKRYKTDVATQAAFAPSTTVTYMNYKRDHNDQILISSLIEIDVSYVDRI